MKWMGAGAALAGIGLPACRRVEKYLVPYNEGPEWSVPGVETAYATCLTMGGNAQPVLAACYEGRPVKLIPSLQYPEGPGLPAAAQASILDLYDPGRSKHILFNGNPASEDEFRGAFSSWSRNLRDGGGIGLLLPPSASPLLHSMLEEITRKIHSCASTGIPPCLNRVPACRRGCRKKYGSACVLRAPGASSPWIAIFFIKTPMETHTTSLRPAPRKGFTTKKKTGTEHAFTPWRAAFP